MHVFRIALQRFGQGPGAGGAMLVHMPQQFQPSRRQGGEHGLQVKKGDMLTTSATAGYAVKALNPTLGAVIGKALEDKDYGEAGMIQVAVGRV